MTIFDDEPPTYSSLFSNAPVALAAPLDSPPYYSQWRTSPIYTIRRVEKTTQLFSTNPKSLGLPSASFNQNLKMLERQFQYGQGEFGGSFHSVTFRVNHPIQLYELGFYGPMFCPMANYDARIELFGHTEPNQYIPKSSANPLKKKTCKITNAKIDKLFYIGFEVVLKRGAWYLLQFKIEGPPMQCSREVPLHSSICTQDGRTIIFDFLGSCSKQLPEFRFTA